MLKNRRASSRFPLVGASGKKNEKGPFGAEKLDPSAVDKSEEGIKDGFEELEEEREEPEEISDELEETHETFSDSGLEESGEGEPSEYLPSPVSGALSISDPLRRYIEEMKRYPLLEPEEELALALSFQKSGDVELARRLVTANLRLVVKIAFEYCSYYAHVMDLIQEGNIGLMKAVSKFDPTKGVKLSYYAAWWIRSYILKHILDHFRLVKIGTTQAQRKLFYHLIREKEKLEAQGVTPLPQLLAEKLHVKEKEVIEMGHRLGLDGAGKGELSLDAPRSSSGSDSGASLLDLLETGELGVDERLSTQQWIHLLEKGLPVFRQQLNPKEKEILEWRLLNEEPHTLQEIGERYSMSRERVRQIEAKIIGKLRLFFHAWLKEKDD